jgi:hypothetical protein
MVGWLLVVVVVVGGGGRVAVGGCGEHGLRGVTRDECCARPGAPIIRVGVRDKQKECVATYGVHAICQRPDRYN